MLVTLSLPSQVLSPISHNLQEWTPSSHCISAWISITAQWQLRSHICSCLSQSPLCIFSSHLFLPSIPQKPLGHQLWGLPALEPRGRGKMKKFRRAPCLFQVSLIPTWMPAPSGTTIFHTQLRLLR